MKKYKSHKIVEAAQITGMQSDPNGLTVVVNDGTRHVVPSDFLGRGTPPDGAYLVKYDNDYYSWSPKDVFEAGNSPLIEIGTAGELTDEPIPTKITKEYLLSVIASVDYHRHEPTTLTLCILTLQNGFTVTGESACIDPGQFNEELGKQVAYDDAFEKLWELEGYLLMQKHHELRYMEDGPKEAA